MLHLYYPPHPLHGCSHFRFQTSRNITCVSVVETKTCRISKFQQHLYQMGCICSKAITRSMSIREEFSQGFKSRSAVWEELLTSHTANINTTTSLTSTDAWDLVEEINAKAESETPPAAADELPDSWRFTRSKSCHTLRVKEMVSENSLQYSGKNMAGSRSFHTVEEYDALLERIRLESFEDCFPWDDDKLQKSTCLSEDEYATMSRDGEGVKMDEERETQEGKLETGWKRRAIARGLKTLDISSAELSSIARSSRGCWCRDRFTLLGLM